MPLRQPLDLLAVLLFTLLTGCSKDPLERSIERFDALTAVLEANKHDPGRLLTEFDTFLKDNNAGWIADRAELEALDTESQGKLEAKHEREMERAFKAFMDVSLEIQERLKNDPQTLQAFVERLDAIGL